MQGGARLNYYGPLPLCTCVYIYILYTLYIHMSICAHVFCICSQIYKRLDEQVINKHKDRQLGYES